MESVDWTRASSPYPYPHLGQLAAHAVAGQLACREPFVFAHALAFVRDFSPMHGEQRIDRGVLTKAMIVRGQTLAVRIFQPRREQRDSGGWRADTPKLRYELVSEQPIDAATVEAAADRIAFFLGTQDDLSPFYALAEGDAALAPVMPRLRGFHHVKFPTAFEAACWGLLNQRVGMVTARKMKDALVRALGGSIVLDGVTHRAFPEASVVAACRESELAAWIGHDRKAKAIAAVARAFAAVDDAFLRGASHEDLKAWLLAIYGVGAFTAGFVMYRGLGRFEQLPMSPKFTAAVSRVYGRPLDEAGVRAVAAPYGAWGGTWALYVWASTFVAVSDGPARPTQRAQAMNSP